MKALYEAVQEVLSPYGLVWPIDKGQDNLPVAQATLILLQEIRKEPTDISGKALQSFLFKCMVDTGLYRRTPDNTDQNAVDNYIAVCFAHPWSSLGIYWRCVYRLGWFANDKRELRAWFVRFLGFRPFAKAASGRALNWLDRKILIISMVTTLNNDPTDTSNKCLQVLINWRLKGKYPDIDQAIASWVSKMEDQYPNGLKSLYFYYWKILHPFYEYAPSDWEFLK